MAAEPGQHTLLERIKWSSAQRRAKEKYVSYTDSHEHLGTFHAGRCCRGHYQECSSRTLSLQVKVGLEGCCACVTGGEVYLRSAAAFPWLQPLQCPPWLRQL